MKKIVSTVLAGAIAATTFAATPALADPDWDDWKFKRYSSDRDWDDWDDRDWDDRRWYRKRYRDHDDDGAAAALVFGLAAGAIASGLANQHYSTGYYPGSYERCAAEFRSFNPHTWEYLGYDGYYHRCPY